MEMAVAAIQPKRNVKLKQIALPTEHGSWGFLFEPLLAGILIAPSITSIWFAILLIGAFLTRQPLKIYLNDFQVKRNLPQTEAAFKFILIFGGIFTVGLLGSLYFAKAESFYPFLLILPLGIYQIYCDASKKSRQLLPELTGAIAISSSVAAVTLAGGFSWTTSLALWVVFICRLIPSILYVRNRLKLEKGKSFSAISVAITNFVAFMVVGLLATNGLIPKLPVAMFFILMIRSLLGLSSFRSKIKAMRIGVWEVIYGTLTAFSVVLGFYFKI